MKGFAPNGDWPSEWTRRRPSLQSFSALVVLDAWEMSNGTYEGSIECRRLTKDSMKGNHL